MRFRWIAWLAAAALLLVACGGGADRTKAQVRLINASDGYAGLDLVVDNQLRQGGVGYAASADYVEIDPGNDASTINSAGSATALLTFTPSLSKNKHYSLLAYGTAGALAQLLLDEDVGAPDSGQTSLRIVNAASDAGSLDVYLTGSGDSLAASVPALAGAVFGKLGDWLTVNSSTWRLRVTAAGSKTDVRLDLPGVSLSSRQVATLVLTPGTGGVLVNALLVTQQGTITRLDGTQARLRVAAGVADGGAVSATVGGAVLMNGIGSPAISLYTLVPAGTQPASLAVNGGALALSSLNLTAGSDYTLLFYGPVDGAQAALISDDNHLPSASTQAKVRLVNGISGISTPLALTVDFLPVADSVVPGAASDYALTAPSTTSTLSITASGLSTSLASATNQTFVAGSVYTVFALGSAASAPVAILRNDR